MMELAVRSLFSFPLNELRDYLKENSFAKYAADQVFGWVYKKTHLIPQGWSNVSQKIKLHFEQHLDLGLPTIIKELLSSDGTCKFLLQLVDGQTIEAVIIPGQARLTLCLSSQVGCAIGCRFCYTGTQGLVRNLNVAEIVGQYLIINQWLLQNRAEDQKITNVVFMGQGEPLHNFENIKVAIEILMEPKGAFLGQRKITVSTSGLVPQLERINELPPVNLAISLHAVTDEIRDQLMPINKVYDLQRLFCAIKKIPLKAHRYITFEYLLIRDLNDGMNDVLGLEDLLDKSWAKINIIPFNEYPESHFKRPSDERIHWFRNELVKRGLTCTIRHSMGADILAACGQLKGQTV